MKSLIDNSSGITGTIGIFIGKCLPCSPSEWLVFFSTLLVLCQLFHWGWRFGCWMKKEDNKISRRMR